MPAFQKPKIVLDPLLGIIDVTDIFPLMDVAEFQSLGFKYQLGMAFSIFPSATHTRKQHSLGSYERTRRLVSAWLKYGFINENEARNLPVYALYHDIGHGPFSHVTESLGSVTHEERGVSIVEGLQDVISGAGFDYDLVHEMMTHENPLYLAVSDKNLGTEKLDYLEHDAYYTIGERPGVDYLMRHTYYIDEKVVVHDVALDQAKGIQDFYLKMSKHVYLRKKSSILQRLVEKMTYYLLQSGLSEQELFMLTDFGLLGRFEVSDHPDIQFFYDQFKKGVFPKLAIELKYEDAAGVDLENKPMKFVGLKTAVCDALVSNKELQNPASVEKLEHILEEMIGVPERTIMIIPPFSTDRFLPHDIHVYRGPGRLDTLSNMYPDHFRAMQEYGRSHVGVRIAASVAYRRAVYEHADDITEYIIKHYV